MNFEDWLRNHPKRKYLEKTIKRYIRALEKAGEWLCIELPKSLLAIEDYESFVSETVFVVTSPESSFPPRIL